MYWKSGLQIVSLAMAAVLPLARLKWRKPANRPTLFGNLQGLDQNSPYGPARCAACQPFGGLLRVLGVRGGFRTTTPVLDSRQRTRSEARTAFTEWRLHHPGTPQLSSNPCRAYDFQHR